MILLAALPLTSCSQLNKLYSSNPKPDPSIQTAQPRLIAEREPQVLDFDRFLSSGRAAHPQNTAPIKEIWPVRSGSGKDLVLSLGEQGVLSLWSVEQGSRGFILDAGRKVDHAALSDDAKLLAISSENVVEVWSIADGRRLRDLGRLDSRVSSLAFQPGGSSLLIGGWDGRVYRWKPQGGESAYWRPQDKTLERYIGHASPVSSVAFHPFGRVFFSADWSGTLSAWMTYDSDIFTGEYDQSLFGLRFFGEQGTRTRAGRESAESITAVISDSKGDHFAIASQDGKIEWWGVRGFKKLAEIQAHKGLIYDLYLDLASGKIVSAGRDGQVKIWNLEQTSEPQPGTWQINNLKDINMPSARQALLSSKGALVVADTEGQLLVVEG